MQIRRPTEPEPERIMRMRWDGTKERAGEIVNWARDAALLPFAAASAPDRNAEPDAPESKWRMRLKVEVPAEMGGGFEWVEVPEGATIHVTGKVEDPTFHYRTPRQAAHLLKESE